MQHSDWSKNQSKVMNRLCLDYSSPGNWDAAKLTLANVDVVSAWNVGRAKAVQELNKGPVFQGENSDFICFQQQKVTLLKPNGTKCDWSD